MTYDEMRKIAQSGDVLLVRGNALVRVFSAESVSHIAVLVWMPAMHGPRSGGLWVFEFVEGTGYQSLPASQWFAQRRGQLIFYGRAPYSVTTYPDRVFSMATRYRYLDGERRRYGWLSLATVWMSQILDRRLPVWAKVCSTFAQEVWEFAGYHGLRRTADPGDFVEHCQSLTRIEEAA